MKIQELSKMIESAQNHLNQEAVRVLVVSARSTDDDEEIRKEFQSVVKITEDFDKANFPGRWTLSGYNEGEISHYDMEAAFDKKYSNTVVFDSESGQFFAYSFDKKRLEELGEELSKVYPEFEYALAKPRYDSDYSPWRNTRHAEEFLAENKIDQKKVVDEKLADQYKALQEHIVILKTEKKRILRLLVLETIKNVKS